MSSLTGYADGVPMVRTRQHDERCPVCGASCGQPCANLVELKFSGTRRDIKDPSQWCLLSGPVNRLEVSYDGGQSWHLDRSCSERTQVESLARGLLEFVSHRSRRHEYPSGAVFRWHGEVLSFPRRAA